MNLTLETKLTFEYPSGRSAEMTWGQFSTINADDRDMLVDIASQLTALNYAEIGGGAAPLIRIEVAS